MSYFSKSKNTITLLKVFPEAIQKCADSDVYYIESMEIAFSIFKRSISFYNYEGFNLIIDPILQIDYSENQNYLLTEDDLKFILSELNNYFIKPADSIITRKITIQNKCNDYILSSI